MDVRRVRLRDARRLAELTPAGGSAVRRLAIVAGFEIGTETVRRWIDGPDGGTGSGTRVAVDADGTIRGRLRRRVRSAGRGTRRALLDVVVDPSDPASEAGPALLRDTIASAPHFGLHELELNRPPSGDPERDAWAGLGFVERPPARRGRPPRWVRAVEPPAPGVEPVVPWVDPNPGWRVGWTALALLVLFGIVSALRLEILFQSPYPPGSDISEQLFWLHGFLGTSYPLPTPLVVPPLYLVGYYLPFISALPLFSGMELLMGVTPALLVFPMYYLLRRGTIRPPVALFGAALAGLAPPWSLLLSWNGGFSLFSFLFAVLFFGALVALIARPSRPNLLLASAALALTAGAHYLTLLYAIVGLVVFAAFVLLAGPARRTAFRNLALTLIGGSLLALPFVPEYLNLVRDTYNVSPTGTSGLWVTVEQAFLDSWGGVSLTTPVILLDTVLSLVALAACVAWLRRGPMPKAIVAMTIAGVVLSITDSQNTDRGSYYLPLALVPAISLLLDRVVARFLRPRARPGRAASAAPSTAPRRRWRLPGGPRGTVVGVAAASVGVALLVLNGNAAYVQLESAAAFYAYLTPTNVELLDWLADHTPLNASIYTSDASLRAWIWGYANRQSFAPAQLNLENTRFSYATTYDANLFALGTYVIGNSYLNFAASAPHVPANPIVFVRNSELWYPVFIFSPAETDFLVTGPGVEETLVASQASVVAVNFTTPCSGCTAETMVLGWPGDSEEVTQTIVLDGTSLAITWSASPYTVEQVDATIATPPSGGAFSQVDLPAGVDEPSLANGYALSQVPFSVSVEGGVTSAFSQVHEPTGWTNATYVGSPYLAFSFSGLLGSGPSAPYAVETPSLLDVLGVSYLVADYSSSIPALGYILYERCVQPGGMPGYSLTKVYQIGPYYVFQVT